MSGIWLDARESLPCYAQTPLAVGGARLGRSNLGVRLLKRIADGERGQALVEFAVVVPVMVTVVLFALYFYEAIQTKLKVQEAARYAAWEFTAYNLHDYNYDRGRLGAQYNAARGAISADVSSRYFGMDSSQDRSNLGLMVRWDLRPPELDQEDTPPTYGGSIGNAVVNAAALALAAYRGTQLGSNALSVTGGTMLLMTAQDIVRPDPPEDWGFNTKGWIQTRVHADLSNLLMPGWYRGALLPGASLPLEEKYALVVDSWHLGEGGDVWPSDHPDNAFGRQVERMTFVNRNTRTWVGGAMRVLTERAVQVGSLASVLGGVSVPSLTADPLAPTVASLNYYRDLTGRITLEEDSGDRRYDTAPNRGDHDTVRRARGRFYMGCPEPEALGCTGSLSSDNPLGDLVYRGEGENP